MKKRNTTRDIKFDKEVIIEFNEDQLRELEGGAGNNATPGTKTTVHEPTTITFTSASDAD